MNVGLIGTGAIAHKHAQSYQQIGYRLVAVSNRSEEKGRGFANEYGAEFVADHRDLCARRDIDYLDICAFPDSRLEMAQAAASKGKHVLVQKPIAVTLGDARAMLDCCSEADVSLGVISQHRFDDSTIFLRQALEQGRLGKILQADAYVKWHRPQAYYDRLGKGSWSVEGGGALINQGIHALDLMLYLAGPIKEVYAQWQLAAAHKMESDDVVSGVIRYASGATGVIQASTAIFPGYSERIEIHGTNGSAIITGDRLTAWDVESDSGEEAPLAVDVDSGASDSMAISLEPIKRQLLDFGKAVREHRKPLVDGEEGYRTLEAVLALYDSARSGHVVRIS